MTLRPEPVTAFFVVAVLALQFASGSVRAPGRSLWQRCSFLSRSSATRRCPSRRCSCRHRASSAGLEQTSPSRERCSSGLALFAVLAFVGSDLTQRRADAQWTRTYGPHADWRDEFLRYSLLQDYAYGTPMRRAFVALVGLAVLAFLLRRRPERARAARPPVRLARPDARPPARDPEPPPVPVRRAPRNRRDRGGSRNRTPARDGRARPAGARPFIVLAAATLAAAWAWSPRPGWNPLDLRTLEWTLAVEDSLPLQSLAVGLPLLLPGALWLAARSATERDSVASCRGPRRFAVPLMAFTATVLVADAIKTDGWTLTRQNLGTLRGDLGCGLADDVHVADRSTLRALPVAASGVEPSASLASLTDARRSSSTRWDEGSTEPRGYAFRRTAAADS